MTKVKIMTDDGEKEIDMKNPKKKHVKKLWSKLKDIQKSDKKEYAIKFNDFLEERDKIAMELSGITLKEWDELEVQEAEKISGIVGSAAFGELDFSKLFGKPRG